MSAMPRRNLALHCAAAPPSAGSSSTTATSGEASPPASPQGLKARLMQDMKEAMKSKEKSRLAAIRAIQTAIKQKEVDDRQEQT